jgi:hypothetical protein
MAPPPPVAPQQYAPMPQQQPTYYEQEKGTNPLVVIIPVAIVLIAIIAVVALVVTGTINIGSRNNSQSTWVDDRGNDDRRGDDDRGDRPLLPGDDDTQGDGGITRPGRDEHTPSDVATGNIPSRGGVVHVNGTTEFYFTPNTAGVWEFRTSGNLGDPLLEIFDENRVLIARDDDSGGALNALIRHYLADGQTYIVNARFFGTGTGSYTLTVTPPGNETPPPAVDLDPPPVTDVNPPLPDTPVTSGSTIPRGGGAVQVIGTTEFTFTPNESGMWEFRTSNNTGDPLLELFDSTGTRIARDDDSGGGLNALIRHNLTAGQTYTVNARFFSTGTGSYTLTVSPPTQLQNIPAGGGSVQVSGTTEFSFTPNTSGVWELRTSNNTGDPLLELYDANRTQIARDDDGAGGLNALIRHNLVAGQTYIINARFWSTGTGSYTLTVTPPGAASDSGASDSNLVGLWRCLDNSQPHVWLCELRFTADGRFTDMDGDHGNYTISGNSLTLAFDVNAYGTHTVTYRVSGNTLTLTGPGLHIALTRQ